MAITLPADGVTYRVDTTADAHILPLLADKGNQQILIDWLETHYQVVSPGDFESPLPEEPVDLCLMDGRAFRRHQDRLMEWKEEAVPRILPYLFVHQKRRPPLDPAVRKLIDDIIVPPISKQELAWRIESLLQMRDLSLQLARRNEQVEHIAGAAAHDLRNPLNVAQGYLEQLGEGEMIDRIAHALTRMERLIDEVLVVTHIDDRVDDAVVEAVAMDTLVDECWEVIPTADAAIEVDQVGDPTILAVRPLLQQLLENLFANAIEHGGDTVTIRVGLLPDEAGFYVEDDGTGIPPEDRNIVFDEGYTTGAGAGLGLVVVKRICDAHGWVIDIAQSEGGGTRFEITGVERP